MSRNAAAGTGASRRTRLTPRGWVFASVAAILVVCAYSLARPELLFIGAFVAASPLLSLLLVGMQRLRLDVRRTFSPPIVTAGRSSTVTLEITNLSPRPMAATTWQDYCGWSPQSSATGRLGSLRSGALGNREPRASARLSYALKPPRRGIFEIGPFTVTLTDPFGLAQATQLAHQTQTITVVPDAVALPDSGLTIAEAEGSARLVQHRAVGGDHDITTRAYRTGDALRRVHWRASAHHGDLMVRQEEQRSHSEASVLLETRRSGYRDFRTVRRIDEPESDAFEWAVGFTASLVVHLQHSGFLVHMHESAPHQLSAVDHTTRFLESLATITLSTETADPVAAVLARGGQRAGRAPGSMFAIVADADDETIEALADHRSAFELAVAFIVMPVADRASVPLAMAGWSTVLVRPGDTVETAWLSVNARSLERYGSL